MRDVTSEDALAQANSRAGFALAAALAVLVLLSILVVTVFANAMASFRSGMTDLGKSRTYYAAEALEDAVIDDDELDMITAPVIAGFSFDSFSVQKIGSVLTERITDGPFAGLYSRTQMAEIHSEAADNDFNSSATLVTTPNNVYHDRNDQASDQDRRVYRRRDGHERSAQLRQPRHARPERVPDQER